MNVTLKSKVGVVKTVKVGFSWTTFFFGWWVALFRGDIITCLKFIVFSLSTLGIYPLVKCFSYNKDYAM